MLYLIVREFELRCRLEPVSLEEYVQRFPDFGEELSRRLEAVPRLVGPKLPKGEPLALAPMTGLPAISGYEVLDELGRGGMGVVYRAWQVDLRRLVALKMVLTGSCAGLEERARFRAEAQKLAQLQHPGIVQVHGVGEQDGRLWFAMELVEGGSLAQKLAGKPQPASQAARLVATLARTIHSAHGKGIIHRDLKPANVLLVEPAETPLDQCTPKITDFGLAKQLKEETASSLATPSGAIVGTPSYMAPEQAQGRPGVRVGPAADVYALGALLYECLTGRPPFLAATALDTVLQVISEEPVPPRRLEPRVPVDLEIICLKCLEKDPRRRYASAADLAADLDHFLVGEPICARPVGTLERAWRWAGRNPRLAVLGATTAFLLLALATGSTVAAALINGARQKLADKATKLSEANDETTAALVLKDRAIGEVSRTNAELCQQKAQLERERNLAQESFQVTQKQLEVYLKFFTTLPRDSLLVADLAGLHQLEQQLEEAARRFEKLAGEAGEEHPEFYANWAKALYQLGSISHALHPGEEAVKLFEQSLAISEKLVSRYADNDDYQEAQAVTSNALAITCQELNDLPAASKHYEKALEVRRRQAKAHPDDEDKQLDLARTLNNLGLCYRALRQVPEARAAYDEALAIRLRQVEQHKDSVVDLMELVMSYSNLGEFHVFLGELEEARKVLEKAAETLEQAKAQFKGVTEIEDHENAEGMVYGNLCYVYILLKDYDRAEELCDKALAAQEGVVERHPNVIRAEITLARGYRNRLLICMEKHRHNDARAAGAKALAIHEKLAPEHLKVLDVALDRAVLDGFMGLLALGDGEAAEALSWAERSLPILEDILEKDPEQPNAQKLLGSALLLRAEALTQLGRYEEGLKAWDRTVEAATGPVQEFCRGRRLICLAGTGAYQRALAEAQGDQGITFGADRGTRAGVLAVAAAEAAKDPTLDEDDRAPLADLHARKAVKFLGALRADGYFKEPEHVAELRHAHYFDSLRKRQDFKKLLKQVEEAEKSAGLDSQ